jgi:hypothetical protein
LIHDNLNESRNQMAGKNSKQQTLLKSGATALFLAALAGFGIDFYSILLSDSFKIIPHTLSGWIGLILLGLLCLTGAAAILFRVWAPGRAHHAGEWVGKPGKWLKLLGVILVFLIPTLWIFTPWKDIHPGFWVLFFFYSGCAVLLSLLFNAENRCDFFSCLVTAGLLFVYSQSVQEIWNIPTSGVKWRVLFWIYYPVAADLTALFALSAQNRSGFINRINQLSGLCKKLGLLRWVLALIILLILPWLCLYSPWGDFFNGNYFRLALLGLNTLLITCLVGNPADWKSYFLILGIHAYTFSLAGSLTSVSNYPFALGWSEGNRFYDYSSVFGQYLYQIKGAFSVPYFSPGRYGLWGIWFVIPGLPIGFHRLWDVVLWTALPLIAGWLLARRVSAGRLLGWGITFWAALFINQGPVYPPLVIAAILVLLFADRSIWLRLPAVAVASAYAGLSRFTWALSAGIWIGLIDLFVDYPARTGNWFKRLLPTLLLAAAGILPGVLISWVPVLTNTQTGFLTKQPFLWYRLWPNTTYAPGIAFGLLLAVCPTLIALGWMLKTRRWKMDVWQGIAVAGSLLGFLGMGLTASVKIGGGSNLHNMDMFLFTVLLLAVTGIHLLLRQHREAAYQLPNWVKTCMVLAVLFPVWNSLIGYAPVHLPEDKTVRRDIQTIQTQVDDAKKKGEVLFMDQRQLLTFGTIKGVNLVTDYEKKYMMDQAMGNNSDYFEQFRKDLASHRFSLIVSETLKVNYSEGDHNFNEENDAWVKYVSETVLKYYRPIATLKEYTRIQLFIPIQ